MIDTLEESYAALKRGWSVIPIARRSKKPLLDWKKFQTNPPTESQIEEWLSEYFGANIAFVTGSVSGISVLDIDPKSGGKQSMAALVSQFGDLPETPVVLTGSGGFHYYFKYPSCGLRNSAGVLGDGIDIRGEGGYVVAPSSTHPNGELYRWEKGRNPAEIDLASMPDWMINKLSGIENTEILNRNKSLIKSGKRHNTLLSYAGLMHSKGLSPKAIRSALIAESNEVCDPPLPEEEIFELVLDVTQRYGRSNKQSAKDSISLNFVSPKDWLEEPENPMEWVVEELLPKGSLTMLAAPPKAGKSTFARQMAMAVSTGDEFLGKETVQGSVLLLAIEEPGRNVRDAFRALGIRSEDPVKIHFGRIDTDVVDQLEKVILEVNPALVIIDTVGRIRSGHLEINDYISTEAWLEPFLYLAHETETAVCLIYHYNKSGRSSTGYEALFSILGSVGISATIDHLIGLTRKKDGRRTFFTVGRYIETPETVLAFDPDTQRLTTLGTAEKIAMSRVQSNILELLQEGTHTTKEIRANVTGRTVSIDTALKALYEDGLINRTGSGNRQGSYSYSLGIVNQAHLGINLDKDEIDSRIPFPVWDQGIK